MKKNNIKKMGKMVGAFAFVAAILGSTSCLAHGCPTSCVHEIQKVVVTEPACAAELPYQLGTAVRYEQNGDTSILEIMGSPEEVAPEYVGAKRQAIREGKLVFAQEYHDIDTNFTSVKLVMKENLDFYPGFVKSKIITRGDYEEIVKKALEHEKKGYKVVNFSGYDFAYESGAKADLEMAKKF